jgi:hypothetical protein
MKSLRKKMKSLWEKDEELEEKDEELEEKDEELVGENVYMGREIPEKLQRNSRETPEKFVEKTWEILCPHAMSISQFL